MSSRLKKAAPILIGLVVIVFVFGVLIGSDGTIQTASADDVAYLTGFRAEFEPQGSCNDGSEYKYHVRLNPDSKRWLIFHSSHDLHCWDEKTCLERWDREFDTGSTLELAETYSAMIGIESNDPALSPLADANLIHFHYCTSDLWAGTVSSTTFSDGNTYSFMGYYVLEDIRTELTEYWQYNGLGEATDVVIMANGAGFNNIFNKMADTIVAFNPDVAIRGILDGSYYIDQTGHEVIPQDDMDTCSYSTCQFSQSAALMYDFVEGIPNDECQEAGLTWECFFAHNVVGFYRYPFMIAQEYYDFVNLLQAGIWSQNPTLEENREWNEWYYTFVTESLLNLPELGGTFAPACTGHGVVQPPTFTKDWPGLGIAYEYVEEWLKTPAGAAPPTVVDEVGFLAVNEDCAL